MCFRFVPALAEWFIQLHDQLDDGGGAFLARRGGAGSAIAIRAAVMWVFLVVVFVFLEDAASSLETVFEEAFIIVADAGDDSVETDLGTPSAGGGRIFRCPKVAGGA